MKKEKVIGLAEDTLYKRIDLQKIKTAIETFLEIECGDIIMKKEKEAKEEKEQKEAKENNIYTNSISPYILRKQKDINIKIKKLKKGSSLDYKSKTWNIVNETRCEWEDGSTDKLFELCSTKKKTILLFIQQDGDNLDIWLENKLPLKQFKD